VWFGWRARRAGARISFADDALVHHAVFPRGPRGHAAERARLRHFPAIARRVPELRDVLFFRRAFLSRRSAALDLALGGAALALAARRPGLAALATAPYAALALREAAGWGPRLGPRQLAGALAADAVGAAALARGSLEARTLLL
jgi:hypothetical protein